MNSKTGGGGRPDIQEPDAQSVGAHVAEAQAIPVRAGAEAGYAGEADERAAEDKPRGRPGRKPKGTASVPVPVPDLPDQPDPDHVLTWRQRKVLQVIRESVQRRGYPPSMREIGRASCRERVLACV